MAKRASKPDSALTKSKGSQRTKPLAAGQPKRASKNANGKGRGSAKRSPFASDREGQANEVVRLLAKAYPEATCALQHASPYELLVATILSAQCTDERVNMVTPTLFAKYPDIPALAKAPQAKLEDIIRSTGFFRAKATSLRGMAQGVMERFGGEIPRSLDELITLPGVGRKTANVLLGTAWRIPSGLVVDTHVKRISFLLGLTRSTVPEQIEQDLIALIPEREWIDFSHRMIHHGRQICIARRPKCLECPLLSCCDRVGLPPLA